MAAIASSFLVDGIPRNGATVKLWSSGAAFLTSPPQKNTALPLTGSALQSTTTGTSHGGDGMYRFTGVTAGVYYVSIEWNSLIVYDTWEIPTSGTPTGVASVKAYGAVGDGSTSDTTAIQAALNDTAVNGLYFPPGAYVCGTVNINDRNGLTLYGDGATLQFTGAGTNSAPIGLRIMGSCTNIAIRDLRFLGNGTAAHFHVGVQVRTGTNLERLTIRDCTFVNCCVGVWANGDILDTWQSWSITDNFFDTTIGTGTTQGRGIRINDASEAVLGIAITNNRFFSTTVHAIELVAANGVQVRGNQIRLHRSGIATGAVVAAITLREVAEVIVAGNNLNDYADGALSWQPANATETREVQIVDNVLYGRANAVQAINLSSSTPATDGTPQSFILARNVVHSSGIEADLVSIQSGLRGIIKDNLLQNLDIGSGTHAALVFSASQDNGGTRLYTDDLLVEGNLLYGTTSGGTFTGIELGSAFCTSTARVVFRGNRVRGGTMFASGATITNDQNLHVIDQEDDGLTLDTGIELETMETGPTTFTGSVDVARRSITSNYTLTQQDQVVAANANGGTVSITFPAANSCGGRAYTIIRTDSNTGFTVQLLRAGTDTFNGLAAFDLLHQDQSVTLVSNGSSRWNFVARYGYGDIQSVRTITASTSADNYDRYVRANAAAGDITLTLPSVAAVPGMVLTVTRVTSTANNITLDGSGAETIDGAATYVLPTGVGTIGNFVTIVNNGSAWFTVEVAD